MQSQNDHIISHLKSGKRLTPLQALAKFGCLRLGARIHNLKERGYDIKSELIHTKDGQRVARYSLAK